MKIAYIGEKPSLSALQSRHFPLPIRHKGENIRETNELCRQLLAYNPTVIQLQDIEGGLPDRENFFSFLRSFRKPVLWIITKEDILTEDSLLYTDFRQKKELLQHFPGLYFVYTRRYLRELAERSFLAEYPSLYIPQGFELDDYLTSPKTEGSAFRILIFSEDWNEDHGRLAKILPHIPGGFPILIGGKNAAVLSYSPRCEIHEKISPQLYREASLFFAVGEEKSFPLSSLHALASDLPVLAFAGKGREEIATDIVKEEDLSSLRERILFYWSGKKGISPRAVAREYSLDYCRIRYELLYQILEERL